MAQSKRIFISYSHKDQDWCDLFERQLKSVHDPLEYDLWIDSHKIGIGDRWLSQIEQGLRTTDVAVLLISSNFLSSDFIRTKEQQPLLDRRDGGMLLLPVLIGACPWEQIEWLESTQMRPQGGRSLRQIGKPTSEKAELAAAEIVNEITMRLKKGTAAASATPDLTAAGTAAPVSAARRLLAQVLLGPQDDKSRQELAAQLVDRIAGVSGLAGSALFNAVRLFVEFHLFRTDSPSSPLALLGSLEQLPGDKTPKLLINCLKLGAATGDCSRVRIRVNAMFFMLAREREDQWEAYFEALRELAIGAFPQEEIATLALVDAQWGFIAPQFLVAGLLSRFDDDWRPVLNVYRHTLPNADARDGGFASLQASQWNCWLVWGPSAPICRCQQWRGHYAFQYGYGDENNSLPLFELNADPGTGVLDALAGTIVAQGQGAGVARLTGRLGWAPFVFRPDEASLSDRDDDGVDDIDSGDDDAGALPARPLPKRSLADAQAALLCGDSLAHAQHSDGLILELDMLEPSPSLRGYFSAYLWMMFLVAGPTLEQTGPRLLRGRAYPKWPQRASDRLEVRSKQLWRDLVPVFVHANVADRAALRFQRRTLIDSALATLRQVWQVREQCFDDSDVKAGIHFYLVCASDYSGCGDSIRFPADENLATLIRERLAGETDRDFAEALVLPAADETADTRPSDLASYFSSCHLHELVGDYYDHVAKLNEDAKQKAIRRR